MKYIFTYGFFLAACLTVPLPSYAQGRACTEMGCTNGLILRVDPAKDWKSGNYVFEFVLDGRRVTCRGELPLKPCEEPSIRCDKPGISIMESGCALPKTAHAFGDIQVEGDPRKIMARITHNGKTIVTRTIAPRYTTSQPNGPGCDPVCRSAQYDLFTAQ